MENQNIVQALGLACRILHRDGVFELQGMAYTSDEVKQLFAAYSDVDPHGYTTLCKAIMVESIIGEMPKPAPASKPQVACRDCEAMTSNPLYDGFQRGPYCLACWEYVPDEFKEQGREDGNIRMNRIDGADTDDHDYA